MKTIALLLVLLAVSHAQKALKGGGHQQQQQNSQCPTNCNCKKITDHENPHISYGMANCTAMPAALDHSIRHLKVNAVIGTLTKEMIAALGKDLRILDLSGCQITRIEKGAFSSSQQLETLILSQNELTDLDEGVIACHALEKLYLDGNKLKRIDNDAFHRLQSLEYLYLQQNKLQKFSVKLPNVIVLDISYNNIKNLDLDISMTQLKSLDLCSNDLDQFPFKTSTKSNNLEKLCLSDKAAFIPEGVLVMFPSLKNLTLMASDTHRTSMDKKIQTQLKKLNELSILSIVSYHLHNLEFFPDNLMVLTLRNVVVENSTGIQHLTNLNNLILDQSPELVPLLLQNVTLMSNLTKLHEISLRKTYIVSFGERNIPKSVRSIDIAENPLRCDCKLAWIVARGKFLMDTAHTICQTPQNVYQQRLEAAINPGACSNSDDGILEQSDKDEWHEDIADHTLLYIILGMVLLILLLIGITLAIVLTVMKRRRKCHISPEGGEVRSERTQQQQMKQSSSSDMLIKK